MRVSFSKELYNKEAIFKAAYSFTDKWYIHIDSDSSYFWVDVTPKSNSQKICEAEFANEVLAQMVRQHIRKETRIIRELMLARAFSSTVIENQIEEPIEDQPNIDIKNIITDWFEKYE